jgi:6-phosphogluconolactonase
VPASARYDLAILPTAELIAAAAARRFAESAEVAIQARGRFVAALSGGATPREMYARLAAQPLASAVDWSRVEVLWGDERCVPPGQDASNYRMARMALLDHVPVDPAHVHRIRGEDPPDTAASAYEREIRHLLGTPEGPPSGQNIDLVLLGLGQDGHTASLFPGGAWLHDPVSWVRAEYSQADSQWRVTLTPVLINAAAEIIFLVAGGAKAAIVRQVLETPPRPDRFPAQIISPPGGRVRWFLDAAAAGELSGG